MLDGLKVQDGVDKEVVKSIEEVQELLDTLHPPNLKSTGKQKNGDASD